MHRRRKRVAEVDAIGRAAGVTYQDNEPLRAGPIVDQRRGDRGATLVAEPCSVARARNEQAPLAGALVHAHRALLHRSSSPVT